MPTCYWLSPCGLISIQGKAKQMLYTPTSKKLPKLLWLFAKLFSYRSPFLLVRVEVYISTGHWQRDWSWPRGPITDYTLRPHVLISVFHPIPRVQLTLARYCVHPEALITRAGVPSK